MGSVFTGIVHQRGRVEAADASAFGVRLVVDARSWPHRPRPGDSIAVDGCCLTVADPAVAGEAGRLGFDIVRQTLDVTTLGDLDPGDEVHLEHAVTPETLLGGHVVQGHVDGVGEVTSVTDETEHRVRVRPPPALMAYIVEKGSIAINGVSLTIAAVTDDAFEVALIPTTLELTTLGRLETGSSVNLETDYIAKVVVNYLQRTGPPGS